MVSKRETMNKNRNKKIAVKTARLHVYVKEEQKERLIREKASQSGMSISDFLISSALNFGEENGEFRKRKKARIDKTDKITGQFHLRTTPEAKQEIKKKAAKFSMTTGDFVVFATLSSNVVNINEKLKKIEEKIKIIEKDK